MQVFFAEGQEWAFLTTDEAVRRHSDKRLPRRPGRPPRSDDGVGRGGLLAVTARDDVIAKARSA